MTKKDLGEIKNIVQEAIDARITPVETEIAGLKHQVGALKEGFNHINQKTELNHREVMAKLDRFLTMESEDVTAVAQDVEELKIRVTKLETGRA